MTNPPTPQMPKPDRVEELEKLTVKSFDLLNDSLVLLEGSTQHLRAMKLIQQMQNVYDQALTNPGEKGAEG